MKKLLIAALVLALLAAPALAKADIGAGQGGNESDQTELGEEPKQEQATNLTNLRKIISQREQELNTTLKEVRESVRTVHENQNKVVVAVHALLSMENLTGGIGKNVSAIARDFNNSVHSTLNAEERIAERNAVITFLFGGDETAAAELLNQSAENNLRIRELEQLRDECNCSDEVKAEYDSQIQALQQEQDRLRTLAQDQLQIKGIFGWLWK